MRGVDCPKRKHIEELIERPTLLHHGLDQCGFGAGDDVAQMLMALHHSTQVPLGLLPTPSGDFLELIQDDTQHFPALFGERVHRIEHVGQRCLLPFG